MQPVIDLSIPRARYGLMMAGATIVALGLVWAVCVWMGGDGPTLRAALTAMAVGSVATFAPAVMVINAEYWGVAVLVSGTARSLAAVALAFMFTQNDPAVASRPAMLSISSGAMLVLAVEVIVAISILSAIERRKAELRVGTGQQPAMSGGSPPPPPQHT